MQINLPVKHESIPAIDRIKSIRNDVQEKKKKRKKKMQKKNLRDPRREGVVHEALAPFAMEGLVSNNDESRSNLSDVGLRFPRLPEATDRLIKRESSPTGSELERTAHSSKRLDREALQARIWLAWRADRGRNFASRAGICSFDLSFRATRGPFVNRRFERRVVAQPFYVAR